MKEWPATNNDNVFTFSIDFSLSHGEGCVFCGKYRTFFSCETNVDGSRHRHCGKSRLFGFNRVAGYKHRHSREHAHERDVFKRLMGGAIGTDRNPCMCPCNFYRNVIYANSGANLFVVASGAKRGIGRNEWDFSVVRHACGNRCHVLLGNAKLDETFGKFFLEQKRTRRFS